MGLASIRTKRTGMLKMASAVTGKNSQSIYFRLLICNIYTKPWWSMNFEILIMMLLWPLWTRWLCSNDAMSLRVELITRFRFTRRPGHIVWRLHSACNGDSERCFCLFGEPHTIVLTSTETIRRAAEQEQGQSMTRNTLQHYTLLRLVGKKVDSVIAMTKEGRDETSLCCSVDISECD